ncbi:MAG: Flp family type IVb pilin [Mesorhizobium sp.]|uniref:Flp family type IVb pilin n=1 Tax=Mesorhizobium sp. TaxID=1871066 RepID=UPI0011FFC0E0|nr:Flp family type IVb pilin [Mesorhizobium sp.]TIR26747.1 MAG: Flp family type IVb pilin [Mesorhizobium sp.]
MQRIASFLRDDSGATAIEYGLIAALIALGIMVGATSLGGALNAEFVSIATTLNGAGSP